MCARVRHGRGPTFAALSALALAACGCWLPPPPTAEQSEQGLVCILPGIEGRPWSMEGPYQALRDAGVTCEIRVFDWQRGLAIMDNLTDIGGNLYRAATLAGEVADYKQLHPDAPVDLVGYSGGGGLAILTLEALPPGTQVRNVLLVQAAISPWYDLSDALAHIDGKLVNFYSPLDSLILGLGTEMFGTIDRSYGESAGKEGFNLQSCAPDPQQRDKIEQVCWTPDMLRTGHIGTHMSMVLHAWNEEYVAPYLVGK